MKELCNAAELHVDVEASPFGKIDNSGKKEGPETHPDLITQSKEMKIQGAHDKSNVIECCDNQSERVIEKAINTVDRVFLEEVQALALGSILKMSVNLPSK